MKPEIKTLSETKVIGKRVQMSFAHNKTKDLWQSFMPERKLINNNIDDNLFSIEVFPDVNFFRHLDLLKKFEKWAAVQVSDFDSVPEGMETFTIQEGLYAVFHYIGRASDAIPTYEYIFSEWIPRSEFELDNRPHFSLMGEKYKNDDPDSEEELWIPIRKP